MARFRMLTMVSFCSWVSSLGSLVLNKKSDKAGATASLVAPDRAPVVMLLPVA
ncbi:hypothetical protein [Moraxella catarrhalis]|uniref:hypothetical protein n=1 Tax=Moraxella catarrhalis TaxID=480 RepID=UPI00222884DB|nr:hypothetical protein [Moraxella catarrhalis]